MIKKTFLLLVGYAFIKAANGTLRSDLLATIRVAVNTFLGYQAVQHTEDLATSVAARILSESGRTAVSASKEAVDAERKHNKSVFGNLPTDLHKVMTDRTRKQAERADAIRNGEEIVQVEDGIEYRTPGNGRGLNAKADKS